MLPCVFMQTRRDRETALEITFLEPMLETAAVSLKAKKVSDLCHKLLNTNKM